MISRARIALTLASKHFLNSSIQKTRVEELDGEKEAYKLWGPHIQIYSARSPLNRRRFLQLKAYWKALEIYKILRLRDSSPYILDIKVSVEVLKHLLLVKTQLLKCIFALETHFFFIL